MKPPLIVRQAQQHGGVLKVRALGGGNRTLAAEITCRDGWKRVCTRPELQQLRAQARQDEAQKRRAELEKRKAAAAAPA